MSTIWFTCVNMEINTMRARDAFLMNLRLILFDRRLSQTDLATLMGVSKQQVSNLFSERGNLSLSTTEKVAAALEVEETDLFDPKYANRLKKRK